MCCDLWPYVMWPLALCSVSFGFPSSKKNSLRGNYMRKYGNFNLPIWLLSCGKGADLVEFTPLRIIGEVFWSTSQEAIEVIIRGWGETDLRSFMTGLLPVIYFWEADLWWWLFCLKPVISINIELKTSYRRVYSSSLNWISVYRFFRKHMQYFINENKICRFWMHL